jgi:hypothetical protein
LALRATLPFFEPGTSLPNMLERKRFRPTAAVYLLLAGVPMLQVMERLGHGSMAMLTNHYAKVTPEDYPGNINLNDYLSCGKLTVDGIEVEENAWDLYCLRLFLKRSAELSAITQVKDVLRKHLITDVGTHEIVHSF